MLPFSCILDLCLTGVKPYVIISGNYYNVDHFVYKVVRNGSTSTEYHVHEIYREIYDINDVSTFKMLGKFTVPFGTLTGTVIPFEPLSGVDIRGKLVSGTPLDFQATVGTHIFTPADTQLECSVCVPFAGETGVDSLGVDTDPVGLVGDVTIREGKDTDVYTVPEDNAIRVDFAQDVIVCRDTTNQCIDGNEDICAQPALMKVNGVEGNSSFNLIIRAGSGIQVSALTVPPDGGDPFDPSTFITRGIVITYSGPMYFNALVDEPSSYEDYEYALDCSFAGGRELVDGLSSSLNDLENTMSEIRNALP